MKRESKVFKSIQQNRDYYAGSLLVLVGIGGVIESLRYDLGSLAAIGPGAFPLAMGVILTLCGVVIGLGARSGVSTDDDHSGIERPEWRGWLCIIAGFTSFILLAKTAGLFPATFACVFISSFGDRLTTIKSAFVVALAIAISGVIIFYYGLHVPLPPFAW